jgi:hypothetical protein
LNIPARGLHILSWNDRFLLTHPLTRHQYNSDDNGNALMKDHPQLVQLGSGDAGGEEISLLDILDNVLHSGVVIQGSIVISLAGVDLIYVGLNVVLTSVETALKHLPPDRVPAQFR